MGLADMVADFIRTAIESEEALVTRRSDLAERFGCAPSQISYVISTRFSPEQGYIVESRRGGGGYIRIRRVDVGPKMMLMHAVASIGEHLDAQSAAALLTNLRAAGAISDFQARLMASALSERSLGGLEPTQKSETRAAIFKQMLLLCADAQGETKGV